MNPDSSDQNQAAIDQITTGQGPSRQKEVAAAWKLFDEACRSDDVAVTLKAISEDPCLIADEMVEPMLANYGAYLAFAKRDDGQPYARTTVNKYFKTVAAEMKKICTKNTISMTFLSDSIRLKQMELSIEKLMSREGEQALLGMTNDASEIKTLPLYPKATLDVSQRMYLPNSEGEPMKLFDPTLDIVTVVLGLLGRQCRKENQFALALMVMMIYVAAGRTSEVRFMSWRKSSWDTEAQCLFSRWYMAKQLAVAPTSVCETATNEFALSVPFLCAVHFMFHGLARPEIANQLEKFLRVQLWQSPAPRVCKCILRVSALVENQ
jgi:hypothetical protein